MGQSRGRLCPQRMGLQWAWGWWCGQLHGGTTEPAPHGPRESRTRAAPRGGQGHGSLPQDWLAGSLCLRGSSRGRRPGLCFWAIKPGPDASLAWWPFGFPGCQHCANGLYVLVQGRGGKRLGHQRVGRASLGCCPHSLCPQAQPFPQGERPYPSGVLPTAAEPPDPDLGQGLHPRPSSRPGWVPGCRGGWV